LNKWGEIDGLNLNGFLRVKTDEGLIEVDPIDSSYDLSKGVISSKR